MYNDINFHHCLCEGMIEIQNSIKEHSSVKFVNCMGATRYFTVSIKKFTNYDDDIFINRIQSYDHFLIEFEKVRNIIIL